MRLKSGVAQSRLVTIGTIATAWLVAALVSVKLLKLGLAPSPVWFAAGIALAMVLRYGAAAVVGVAIAAFVFGLLLGASVKVALLAAAGSTLGAIVGKQLLQQMGFRNSFKSLRDVLGFVLLAVVLSPMVNATIQSLNASAAQMISWHQFRLHWWTVWLGDGVGVLVVTPLLLVWLGTPPPFRGWLRAWQHSLTFRQRVVEVVLWAVLLVGVSWQVFHSSPQAAIVSYPLEYLPFPLLVWAALRLGQRITVLSSLLVSLIAISGAVQFRGPFLAMSQGNVAQAIFLLQSFIGVITVTALMLAAAVAERQQAEDLLRKREASLLNAQRIAQVGSWDLDLPPCCALSLAELQQAIAPSLRWSDELYRILGAVPQAFAPSLELFLAAVHPDDRETVQDAFHRLLFERLPYCLDYRIVLPDGTERLVSEQVEVSGISVTGTVQDITERTLAEVALRESEARFRSMFEAAAIGIGLDNFHGHILESNAALQQMLGYSREELSQMTFADLSHPDDRAAEAQQLQAMAMGQLDAYQLEKRQLHKDGRVLWVRLTNSLVRDAAGKPRFAIGMVENITERKQAEEALQQSEARFRVVAETAACSVMVYQGNHFRYVNPETEAITEYSQAELLTMNFWDLAHPEFRELVRQRGLARQRGEAVPQRYEIKIVTKSGKERWVDFTAGVIQYEGQPAGMATAYDITDRKQAEAKLLLSAERERLLSEIALRIRRSLNLEEILNTTVAEIRRFLQADRVFITRLDADGQSRTVAESVEDGWNSMLDWVGDRAAVQEIKALFAGDATADSGSRVIRVVNDTARVEPSPLQAECYDRWQIRSGIGIPLMLNGTMFGLLVVNQCSAPRQWQPLEIELLEQLATQVEIAIQQGQLYRQVQLLATNLERQVEDRTAELQQRMQELQNLNQVKDLLLHAVSHDLRTPIQGMLMVLNRLRTKCTESIPISRSMLDLMIQSSDHQLHLLNSLMANHSQTEPDCRLNPQPIQLATVLQASLRSLQTFLDQNQAAVEDRVAVSLPLVKADSAQLQQVFEELLINAVKHNPPGVTITVEAAVSPVDPNGHRPTHGSNLLCCRITDDGVGLTPDQRDRIFKLYVRGMDNQHRTGIGLGLHTCRQIITAQGGTVGAESPAGGGAAFWFTLPITALAELDSVPNCQSVGGD